MVTARVRCVAAFGDPSRLERARMRRGKRTDEPINLKRWKRVPGNPFEDYEPAEGIALWSLWEMPSSAVGKLVRRGRPRARPTAVRSRLPTQTWKRLEAEAAAAKTTINALIAKRIG